MGIGVDLARALLREGVRRKFEGKIISLGVQDIFLNAPMLKAILNEFKIDSKVLIELSAKGGLAKDGFISDVSFFKSIGFNDLLRIDATDYEGADIVFDLNCKIRSAESNDGEDALNDVVGAADVVLNGGTVEHVFNVPVALENTFKLLKIGGRVIHTAPCSNHIDHGFYMFSPTFFNDYYLANKFELNDFKIIKYWPDVDKRWETLDYVPGILTDISMGGADNAMYAIYIVATKREESTGDVVPQQGMYAEYLWEQRNPGHRPKKQFSHDPIKGDLKQVMVKRFFNPSSSDFAIHSMKEILGSDNLSNPVEKYRKARKCMLDAISAKGDLTLMYSHCVQLSLAMMEFEDALRYATIVAALLPQDAAAHGQLDMVKERMGVSR